MRENKYSLENLIKNVLESILKIEIYYTFCPDSVAVCWKSSIDYIFHFHPNNSVFPRNFPKLLKKN